MKTLKVKCDLCKYIEDIAKFKSDILAIREGRSNPEEGETIIDELFKLKIDGFFAEEKVILGHLQDLCKAVNEHDLVEVKAAMDALGF